MTPPTNTPSNHSNRHRFQLRKVLLAVGRYPAGFVLVLLLAGLVQCSGDRGRARQLSEQHQRCQVQLAEHQRLLHVLKEQRLDQRTQALGNLTDMENRLQALVPEEKRLEFLSTFEKLTQNYHNHLTDLERTTAHLRRENQLIEAELSLLKRKLRKDGEHVPNQADLD